MVKDALIQQWGLIARLPQEHANFVEPFLSGEERCLVPLVNGEQELRSVKNTLRGQSLSTAFAINGVTGKRNYRDDLDGT